MMNVTQCSQPHIQAPIHVVQKGKPNPSKLQPFFFLHGDWSGEVPFYCFTLARLLGSAQPFYALDTYKYSSPDAPLTLEGIAAAHLQSIRAIQPEGPYLLGGFCSGAYLAYEIAKQLQAQGQKIALLALIAPSEITHNHERIRRTISSISTLLHLNQTTQLNTFIRMRHFIRAIYRRIVPPDNARIKDFPQLLALDPRLAKTFPPLEALYKDFPGVFIWLATGFTPKNPIENATFIWASANLTYRSRWSVVEQSQDSPILPGHYLTLPDENIHLLAEQLKISIDKAQRRLSC